MRKKVLIVDDYEPVREVTKEILERNKALQVSEVSNGKDALHLLQNKSFDLLIVDIAMPEMNGIELIDKLRASGSSVPIIVLSGVLNHNIREFLSSIESIYIIEKTFTIDTLVKNVENILKER